MHPRGSIVDSPSKRPGMGTTGCIFIYGVFTISPRNASLICLKFLARHIHGTNTAPINVVEGISGYVELCYFMPPHQCLYFFFFVIVTSDA